MEEKRTKIFGAKIILYDNDIQWIKENIVYGEPINDGTFQPRTPVYLFDKIYMINQTRQDYESFFKGWNLKMEKTFDDIVLDELKITVCFNPPITLIRNKKLQRIIKYL